MTAFVAGIRLLIMILSLSGCFVVVVVIQSKKLAEVTKELNDIDTRLEQDRLGQSGVL